ncbi:MAG: hypothetical protein ACH37Z_15140 [Anaerolineae bacterium]
MPWPQVQVLAWIDHNDPAFGREVLGRLSAVGGNVQHYFTGEPPAAEDDRRGRRNRITDAWRWFLQEATAPVILGAEDDTLPDADAYQRLLKHLEAGAVGAQGTEVARQLPYVPHWSVGTDEIRSASYSGRTVVPIQGGGWYCSAMVTEAARGCLVAGEDLPLGPDVAFWRELARKGPCVGDWSIECGHFGETFHLHPAMSNLVQVHYHRAGSSWIRDEYEARPYRQACQKTEDGLLRVRVLKPFTGTAEEREKYADANDRLIHTGTVMEMTEDRFVELGVRPNPIVVALSPIEGSLGSSLAAWSPVTKPAVAVATKSSGDDQDPPAETPKRPEPLTTSKRSK